MLSYHINGEEPKILGKRCTGFVLQHFYEVLQITNQVNVAYLRFGDEWYRLYFECATIFWRKSKPPEVAQNTELAYGSLLNDLSGVAGVVGRTVGELAYAASESGDVEVTIRFNGGRCLKFAYSSEADATQLVG